MKKTEEEKKIDQSLFKESPESYLRLHKHETGSGIPSFWQNFINVLKQPVDYFRTFEVFQWIFALILFLALWFWGQYLQEKESRKHLFSMCFDGCMHSGEGFEFNLNKPSGISDCLKLCEKEYGPYSK